MKILIINYHYPPSNTAHSYRWELLRRYFLNQGHEVYVVCGGLSLESDVKDRVRRVNFPRTVRSTVSETKQSTVSSGSSFKVRLYEFFRRFYRKIFWPDGLWHWLPFSLYEVLKLRNHKFDLVVGYSPTFSAVITALFYKKLNDRTKLVIDFGDPFSVSREMPANNYFVYSFLNTWIEKLAFKNASLVSFTNQQTYELYKGKYPYFSNFVIVPHLVNLDDFFQYKVRTCSNSIRIGYVGAFHKKIREPSLVLKKLHQIEIEHFKFEFYGPLNGVDFCESKCVKHFGVVNRSKAIDLIKDFNILINVENEECPMLPSKIYECVATGKPILNFLSGTKITSFCNYPLVLNIDENTSTAVIIEFIQSNNDKGLTLGEVQDLLKDKTLKSVGERYLSVAK